MDFFYVPDLSCQPDLFDLDMRNSKHCTQVLRHQKGVRIQLTDGNGQSHIGEIVNPHPTRTLVKILKKNTLSYAKPLISLAVASLKNIDRIEWLLEKSTEIGVAAMYLMTCERTQKTYPKKIDRFRNIMLSAMLQSQRIYLPKLAILSFEETLALLSEQQNYIAYCENNPLRINLSEIEKPTKEICIFIGPEGDFSPKEITLATEKYACTPLSISKNRLRTETAALYTLIYFSV